MEKFSEIKYVRPDFERCLKNIKNFIEELKTQTDYKKAKEDFLKLYENIVSVRTMSNIAEVRNTLDKTDEFYDKEAEVLSAKGAVLAVAVNDLKKAILKSPLRKEAEKEYGSYIFTYNEAVLKLVSKKIIKELIKEEKLSQQYSKQVALCKTVFRGEECNFYGLLKHMESTDREERREAFIAWANLYESISDKLDKIYDKLIKIRLKKAKKLGFKDFFDYIYLERERIDYNKQDVENFRKQIREVVVPLCQKMYEKQAERLNVEKLHCYDEALFFTEGNAVPIGNKDELVEKADKMYHEMSKETGEFFEFMRKYELFDLETKPGKHLGGYCTSFEQYKAPFIFSNFNGTSEDVDVLTHEAGHAFQDYLATRTLPFTFEASASIEICEIHSMSMEHFAYPYMQSFFGENADKYRYAHLSKAITCIPYLVSVDEFQHRVFENPKMSAKERRKVWREIEKTYMPWRDYDGNKFLEEGGFWMQKQHIFLYPFYYIDYAIAAMFAFQFFIKSREDKEKAWKEYITLCKIGGSKGFNDSIKKANLKSPFVGGTVKEIIEKIKEILDEFEAKCE